MTRTPPRLANSDSLPLLLSDPPHLPFSPAAPAEDPKLPIEETVIIDFIDEMDEAMPSFVPNLLPEDIALTLAESAAGEPHCLLALSPAPFSLPFGTPLPALCVTPFNPLNPQLQ